MSAADTSQVGFSIFNAKANQKIYKEFASQHERDRLYIEQLERLLLENHISIPELILPNKLVDRQLSHDSGIMADGTLSSLEKSVNRIKDYSSQYEINIQYRNLTFWNSVPEERISTVGSSLRSFLFCGSGTKHRVDIIKDLTGRILPGKMTLLMGPPGCGKSPSNSTFVPTFTFLCVLQFRQDHLPEGARWAAARRLCAFGG